MARLDPSDVADSSPDRAGYCYVLTHSVMPGIVKVGASRKHPIRRATELSAGTGVPGAFDVAYYCATPDAFALERATHQAFVDVRVDEGREFFRCEVGEVVAFIRRYMSEELEGDELTEGGEWLDEGAKTLPRRARVATPWAELFASFPDDGGDRQLTPEEGERCRKLALSMKRR